MRIESDTVIPFSRELVFRCYRDEMRMLVDFLPSVREIEVVSRADEGPVVKLVKIWHGQTNIPEAIERVIKETNFSWTDYATWDENRWECDFRIEPHILADVVSCEGTNRFIALDGSRTRVEVTGVMRVDLRRLPAIPEVVTGTLERTIERFFVRQIATNLTSAGDAVTQYLERQTA